MSRYQAFQAVASPAQQPQGRAHRAYTVAQVCAALELHKRTFFRLRAKGELPFLEELRPRIGRVARYRADLVDRYLSGEWNQPRSFRSHATHLAPVRSRSASPTFGL